MTFQVLEILHTHSITLQEAWEPWIKNQLNPQPYAYNGHEQAKATCLDPTVHVNLALLPASTDQRRDQHTAHQIETITNQFKSARIHAQWHNLSEGVMDDKSLLLPRVVSVLDSGAEGPGFKSQSRRCRVIVLGKLFTHIVPMFTKQQNW